MGASKKIMSPWNKIIVVQILAFGFGKGLV